MSDSTVVPLRPGAVVPAGSAQQLLEVVAEYLSSFEANYSSPPTEIAFVVFGEDGSAEEGLLFETAAIPKLAYAALLLERAANELLDLEDEPGD